MYNVTVLLPAIRPRSGTASPTNYAVLKLQYYRHSSQPPSQLLEGTTSTALDTQLPVSLTSHYKALNVLQKQYRRHGSQPPSRSFPVLSSIPFSTPSLPRKQEIARVTTSSAPARVFRDTTGRQGTTWRISYSLLSCHSPSKMNGPCSSRTNCFNSPCSVKLSSLGANTWKVYGLASPQRPSFPLHQTIASAYPATVRTCTKQKGAHHTIYT